MSGAVLIVGGGPAGLSAAQALTAAGQRVHIVEKADRLGGAPILSGYAKLVPSGEWARDAIGGMVARVGIEPPGDGAQERHGQDFLGRAGRLPRRAFGRHADRGRFDDPGHRLHPFRQRQQAGMGFRHLSRRGHHHPGRADDLVGSGGVRCPSDGRKPDRVAILLCVGSRDRQIGREWCSKICCTVSSNLAMEIREELPQTNVYIYYMDIRTFGLYEDKFYWESQEKHRVKYIKARIAEVTSDGKRLIVKGEDTLVKRPITIPFDMVVHAIGMDPNVDNMTLSAVFDVKLERHGYIDKASSYSAMSGTSRPGVFVAGAATGPETIDDSIAQGQSAAMAALAFAQAAVREAAE